MKSEIGYYSVDGVSFGTGKVSAVLEAQKTGAEVKWHFFDDAFSKVNWLSEPETSLDTLYYLRAQQIRNSYDYVIVFLSGGADSNNVIRTFLNNNIHVDEVIAMIPESGMKNFIADDNNYSAGNVMSETKYAQYPILHEVHTKSPNTKITVIDFFDRLLNLESDRWIYETEGDLIGMSGGQYGRLDSLPHLVNIAEQGKRIASVWGTDKPVLGFGNNGSVFTIIADSPVYLPKYPFKTVYPNVDRILFYYNADLPELMVKQAHVVAREIHKPENKHIFKAAHDQRNSMPIHDNITTEQALETIFKTKADEALYSPKTVYQRGIVPFIYPSTHDADLFQVRKFNQTQTFLPAFNNWITELHGQSRLHQQLVSDFTLFYKNISPKYLNASKTGFQMCLKMFRIGNHDDFKYTESKIYNK
jgi:hypothetical protein